MENICKAVMCNTQNYFSEVQIEAIKEAIKRLPEDQQKGLHLKYTRQLSIKEISLQLGVSITTSYSKINRALFILRNEFNPGAYENMYQILYPETGKPTA